uniref:Uncharacterized protein n=1 Tax=Timema monikensis TaxID=170555 RepID=A0A7R9HNB6_9NEOP|nr:unnamed protein product [Timema monikensis]
MGASPASLKPQTRLQLRFPPTIQGGCCVAGWVLCLASALMVEVPNHASSVQGEVKIPRGSTTAPEFRRCPDLRGSLVVETEAEVVSIRVGNTPGFFLAEEPKRATSPRSLTLGAAGRALVGRADLRALAGRADIWRCNGEGVCFGFISSIIGVAISGVILFVSDQWCLTN